MTADQQAPPDGGATVWKSRREAVVAALLAVLALACWDLALAVSRGTAAAGAADHVGFVVTAMGLGVLVLVPPLVLRNELSRWLVGRGPRWHFAAGVLDGAFLSAIWINKEVLRGAAPYQVVALLVAGALGLGVARAWVRDEPRLRLVAIVVTLLGAVAVGELLPWRFMHWTRLGLDFVAAASAMALVRRALPRPGRGAAWAALFLAVACLVSAEVVLRARHDTRWLLYQRASHVRGWTLPPQSLADLDGDGAANLLGGRDCDESRRAVGPARSERPGNGVDDNCEGGDGAEGGAPTSTPVGLAEGADVLVLSIDALRWDLAPELEELADAVGPRVEMELAVTPSSFTVHALSAVVRGRSTRELVLGRGRVKSIRVPHEDPSPTLATVLADHGYAAFMVPTHRYLEPWTGIFAGFEAVETEGFEQVKRASYGIGQPRPIVRAQDALDVLVTTAAAEDAPVVGWVHLMETHEPYWSGPEKYGPPSLEGLRAAVQHVDAIAAEAVRRWRGVRGRPLVVAVLGDHGEEFLDHGGRYHASTAYAEQVRVTMWLSAPGLEAGRVDAPVSTASLAPTVLDLLGVQPPASMTSRSLVPCMRRGDSCPSLAVSEIRTDRDVAVGYTFAGYRLVYDPAHRVQEWFDVVADPFEQHPLTSLDPGLVDRLAARARRWDEAH